MTEEAKKSVHVSDACIGCGTCESISPEYFKIVDGVSKVQKSYDEKDKDVIDEAIESCPVQAISLK